MYTPQLTPQQLAQAFIFSDKLDVAKETLIQIHDKDYLSIFCQKLSTYTQVQLVIALTSSTP